MVDTAPPPAEAVHTLGIESTGEGSDAEWDAGLFPLEEEDEDPVETPQLSWAAQFGIKGRQLLASPAYTASMLVLTVYALFGNDLRLLAFDSRVDEGFFVLAAITFFAFCFDLLLASLVRSQADATQPRSGNACQRAVGFKGYFLSFFFWLDFVAAVSVIPEIPWIWEPLIGESSSAFHS